MKLDELRPAAGTRRDPYRKGRGHGSGNGKTAGKGHKGQNARAGGGVRVGFEGGQTPLYRRIPKRGFNNKRFADAYTEINVSALNIFDDDTIVTAETLLQSGLINKVYDGICILGNGNLTKKLTIKAKKFSKVAVDKIESLGGKAEVV